MFLVDPDIPVLSTANVPPQRQDWWEEEIRHIGPLGRLPQEIFEHVMSFVEYPLSWTDAVAVREKLMAERSEISDSFNKQWTVSATSAKTLAKSSRILLAFVNIKAHALAIAWQRKCGLELRGANNHERSAELAHRDESSASSCMISLDLP
jgi:hypothetical protein